MSGVPVLVSALFDFVFAAGGHDGVEVLQPLTTRTVASGLEVEYHLVHHDAEAR